MADGDGLHGVTGRVASVGTVVLFTFSNSNSLLGECTLNIYQASFPYKIELWWNFRFSHYNINE